VPDAVGLFQPEARARLENASFEVLAIEVFADDESKAERVVSQTPGAGARIPRGSLVILYVAAATR
jgi:beta-lactam-binding protein with PASTA domain